MEFHYPNGKKFKPATTVEKTKNAKAKDFTYSNRGMTLEEDLNETNKFYLQSEIAVIHKKPTPVQIVNVDYPKRSAAVIKEAYFKQASTTDYNGVYKGKYIDFEAKETRFKTSFPLNNFHKHQIEHIKQVLNQNGIAFVILRFSSIEEVYFLEGKHLLSLWYRMEEGGRKSITISEVQEYGHRILLGFRPRIDYIKIVDKLYNLS
ncbi:Holliday junction resolvase RecU [Robertmurraya kyonggiensis]|uniref:Holliday junction resolvase RecU n=1 Tax=Robertmurraya kyonggiensis TaxID=1037680 RepID=A0A4U1DAT8_9BACI|nr:Holliday junction resolvase RecU [Robertmurraya kyonggiensis]TKC19681.1 Holliday junction resolvase RecU [Robertmurraya kyonggiensis]